MLRLSSEFTTPRLGVNITSNPCYWDASDLSSFGGNCYINKTWIDTLGTELPPIER